MPKCQLVTDDPRLNYEAVDTPTSEDLEPVPKGLCGVVKNSIDTPLDKYDYLVPLTDEDKKTTKHVPDGRLGVEGATFLRRPDDAAARSYAGAGRLSS